MTIAITNVHNLYMHRNLSSRRQGLRKALVITTGVVLLLCLLYAAFFAQGGQESGLKK